MLKTMYGLKVKEASERLGISQAAVRILMKRGKLPIGIATQLNGQRYVYYISEDALEKYIRNSSGNMLGGDQNGKDQEL